MKHFKKSIMAISVLSGIAMVQAAVPNKSDILLSQYELGNYTQASTSLSEYFKANWYGNLVHNWRPITQKDKTDFYQQITLKRALGLKIQAKVALDDNWQAAAEFMAIEGVVHKDHAIQTLEGKYTLYASSHTVQGTNYTEEALLQGLYEGDSWAFDYLGQAFNILPYLYSTHSASTQGLLKAQVDVLMGGSHEQTLGYQVGGNLDAIMLDLESDFSKRLYWGGDFSNPSMLAFNQYLSNLYGHNDAEEHELPVDISNLNPISPGIIKNNKTVNGTDNNDYILIAGAEQNAGSVSAFSGDDVIYIKGWNKAKDRSVTGDGGFDTLLINSQIVANHKQQGTGAGKITFKQGGTLNYNNIEQVFIVEANSDGSIPLKSNAIDKFNQVLAQFTDDYQVNTFEEFSYKAFLLALNFTDDMLKNAIINNETSSIPLYHLFQDFNVKAHDHLIHSLKEHADNFIDESGEAVPNIDISTHANLFHTLPGFNTENFDFYSQQAKGNQQLTNLLFKIADAHNKPLTLNQSSQYVINKTKQQSTNHQRFLMAQAYANGANYVVPVKHGDYLSDPGSFEFITDFISGNKQLFDSYSSLTKIKVLHTSPENTSALLNLDTVLEDAGVQYDLLNVGSSIVDIAATVRDIVSADVVITTHPFDA